MNKLHKVAYIFIACFCLYMSALDAQYNFKTENQINCTAIKNQAKTGTCWSFASSSFIESELMRMGKGEFNLSEMYVVRNIYKDKARNYMLRQGKANFSQGSLAHDLMRVMSKDGIIPEEVYTGLMMNEESHDHSEMVRGLKGFLDGVKGKGKLSSKWQKAFSAILDAYIGQAPTQFTYQGKSYTPKTFVESLGINASDYRHITSFSHHPFGAEFILEIPDNYSNGSFYNVKLDKMMQIIDDALAKGYSITWDGDVSEKGFSSKNGMAILPVDEKAEDIFDRPVEEIQVNQQNRQDAFMSYATTDDHLMHIVGTSVDSAGNKYYVIKNSWGERGPHKGYLHMSVPYMKMKTVSVTLHKDAVSGLSN